MRRAPPGTIVPAVARGICCAVIGCGNRGSPAEYFEIPHLVNSAGGGVLALGYCVVLPYQPLDAARDFGPSRSLTIYSLLGCTANGVGSCRLRQRLSALSDHLLKLCGQLTGQGPIGRLHHNPHQRLSTRRPHDDAPVAS